MNTLQSLQDLYFHRLDIRFYPDGPIKMPYWTGAVIRNRFLCAAEKVRDTQGNTLRQLLDTLPLPESHAFYKQLIGGFPKGFLFDCSTLPFSHGTFILEKEHIYTFSLIIIGNCSIHYPLFLAALQYMFSTGFGYPITPLTLIDVCEHGGSLLYSGKEGVINQLSVPFKLGTPFSDNPKDMKLILHFKTPVSLTNHAKKENQESGYQNKLNNFPSFYQFMRSLIYRMATLNMLYVTPNSNVTPNEINTEIDTFIGSASRALLLHANIGYEKRYSTPRIGGKNVYTMDGYCGTLSFGQVNSHFIPLLQFTSHLGIGNDINYGLGVFDVEY